MTINRIWACQRCLDLLPYVQLDGTVKDLQCCFRTSALSWRLKILNSASTLLLCLDCQRPDVPLPHFRSALTAKDLKFRFRSVITAKDLKFHVRTFVLHWLHWLPKMWSSASALPLCLDCQICEVLPPHFRSALTGKDLKFRFPHCQDFQRWEVPLPHFISSWTSTLVLRAGCGIWLYQFLIIAYLFTFKRFAVSLVHFRSILTAKDLKIGFSTNTLLLSSKMGSSACALPFYLDCKGSVVSHFRTFCQDFQQWEVPLLHFISSWTSTLVLRAGCGIWLNQFLIIAYLFTFQRFAVSGAKTGDPLLEQRRRR